VGPEPAFHPPEAMPAAAARTYPPPDLTKDIYVSDGYGNSRAHKSTPDGKLLMSWGEPGTGEGEFNVVHNLCCDADTRVYVADRENHRVQVFDGMQRPQGRCRFCHGVSNLPLRSSMSAKSARPSQSAVQKIATL
jgi:hypothetical protein